MKSEWTYRPLGELVSFASGGTPSKKRDDYWGGTIPWISAKTLKTENIDTSDLFITEEGLKAGSKIAPKGSILLLTRGSGLFNGIPIARVEKDVAFNQDIKCLDSYGEVENEFIFYWLLSQKDYLMAKVGVTGIGAGKFDLDFLQKLMIPIPSERERKSIVGFASSISEKIRCNAKVNDNLEQQAVTYFQELYINNANPMWQIGTISDLGTVVGGSTPSKTKPEYYTNNGIAWITPKDLSINKSKFISHGENDITELGLKNSSTTVMPKGTVLFSSRAPIGYIAIASNEVTTNQGFKSVIPYSEIGTAFVYFFLKHSLPVIESAASGSTFKEISGSAMKNIPAIIPDRSTLDQFNSFCAPIFAQQKILEDQNYSLAMLRDSLLPKLMSGAIDIASIQL
uniref:restriction endonuclease subunit S n=1 Tax=Faecalibacterium prausnitzii TaxID=853 RepID=UPI003FF13DB2